ncbi:MAG: hypothetical protein CMH13_00150 [Martelella sp.]|nr:hypothetical protein [Martelella sp.]
MTRPEATTVVFVDSHYPAIMMSHDTALRFEQSAGGSVEPAEWVHDKGWWGFKSQDLIPVRVVDNRICRNVFVQLDECAGIFAAFNVGDECQRTGILSIFH